MPDAANARFRREFETETARDPQRTHYFVATLDGEPAGTASLLLLDGFAHLNGAAVIASMRRRGVYRALIDARMAFLRERNVPFVTNHCISTTSAPICRKIGFEKTCEFRVFRYSG